MSCFIRHRWCPWRIVMWNDSSLAFVLRERSCDRCGKVRSRFTPGLPSIADYDEIYRRKEPS